MLFLLVFFTTITTTIGIQFLIVALRMGFTGKGSEKSIFSNLIMTSILFALASVFLNKILSL